MARSGGNPRITIQGKEEVTKNAVNPAVKGLRHLEGESKKAGKEIARHALGITAGFTSIVGVVGELESSVHGLEDLTKATALLTRTTGFDAKTSSEWVQVAKLRGVQATQLNMGFVSLARNMKAASEGGKKQADAFKELGVSMDTVKRGDTQGVLKGIADAFEKMPNGANKAALAQQLFGRQARTLTQLLNEGSKGLQRNLGEVAKYGAALDEHGVKKAKQAIEAQHRLELAWQGVQIFLGTKLVPVLAKGADAMASFIRGWRNGVGEGGRLRQTLDNIWTAAKPVVTFFKDHPKLIADAIAAWAAYKIAVKVALAASAAAAMFRKMFAAGIPVAAEEGAAAGAAYSASASKRIGTFKWGLVGIAIGNGLMQGLDNYQGSNDFKDRLARFANGVLFGLPDQVYQLVTGHKPPSSGYQAPIPNSTPIGPYQPGARAPIGGGLSDALSGLGPVKGHPRKPGSLPKLTGDPFAGNGAMSFGNVSFGSSGGGGGSGGGTKAKARANALLHKSHYSHTDLMELWVLAGGSPATADKAAAVAEAESSGNPGATSANPDGNRNLGLWQIDTVHPGATTDPLGNARVAVSLSHNGTYWGIWETAVKGLDVKYLTGQTISGQALSGGSFGIGSSHAGDFSAARSKAQRYFSKRAGAHGQQVASAVSSFLYGGQGAVEDTSAYLDAVTADPSIAGGGPGTRPGFAIGMAKFGKAQALRKRIARIKKALKGHLSKKQRRDLLSELASLTGTLTDLTAAPDQTDATTADATLPTLPSGIGKNIALAALTPGKDDDLAALGSARDFWQGQLDSDLKNGASDAQVTSDAENLKAIKDAIDSMHADMTAILQVQLDLEKQRGDSLQKALNTSQAQYPVVAGLIAATTNATLGRSQANMRRMGAVPGRLAKVG